MSGDGNETGAARLPSRKRTARVPRRMLEWRFPLKRPHAGILLGNGIQGLMVWGVDRTLYVTVARAGFWDHRGGNPFVSNITYRGLRRLLEANDEAAIRRWFGMDETARPKPAHPYQIGGGRLALEFPEGWTIRRGRLNLTNGRIDLAVSDPDGRPHSVRVAQQADGELAWIDLPEELESRCALTLTPSWDFVKGALLDAGCAAPAVWREAHVAGFTQHLPADAPLTCEVRRDGRRIWIRTALAPAGALAPIPDARRFRRIQRATRDGWNEFWRDVPRIALPDPVLQEIVDYGLYKLACSTPPHGVACTLQGPFLEEYQIPPWSADYHFNINIQMIYQPLLAANRLSHFTPLWDLLRSWMDRLAANGKAFFEVEDALMLPHAVDDRCQVVGSFWTGAIDHGCTAWMALLAWQYYRYGGDEEFLRSFALPLLNGAFGGYWAMKDDDGKGGFCLPVSVSPEFRGARMDAWGRNASFQLAAAHAVVRALRRAAAALNGPEDPRWSEMASRLPPYQTIEAPTNLEWPAPNEHIALWEGLDLVASHRHHSHLAGLFPFCTIDPFDERHRWIVERSLNHWVHRGMGAWSGWCVPWAAAIWARCHESDAAVSLLHAWAENFVNEGRGTLHNTAFTGPSALVGRPYHRLPADARNGEVMQLDAGMGALTAVFELLVQCVQDRIRVLPSIPRGWRRCRFDGIRSEGAFLIGADLDEGRIAEVRVHSLKGGALRLEHGLGEHWRCGDREGHGPLFERVCRPGERLVLTATRQTACP